MTQQTGRVRRIEIPPERQKEFEARLRAKRAGASTSENPTPPVTVTQSREHAKRPNQLLKLGRKYGIGVLCLAGTGAFLIYSGLPGEESAKAAAITKPAATSPANAEPIVQPTAAASASTPPESVPTASSSAVAPVYPATLELGSVGCKPLQDANVIGAAKLTFVGYVQNSGTEFVLKPPVAATLAASVGFSACQNNGTVTLNQVATEAAGGPIYDFDTSGMHITAYSNNTDITLDMPSKASIFKSMQDKYPGATIEDAARPVQAKAANEQLIKLDSKYFMFQAAANPTNGAVLIQNGVTTIETALTQRYQDQVAAEGGTPIPLRFQPNIAPTTDVLAFAQVEKPALSSYCDGPNDQQYPCYIFAEPAYAIELITPIQEM